MPRAHVRTNGPEPYVRMRRGTARLDVLTPFRPGHANPCSTPGPRTMSTFSNPVEGPDLGVDREVVGRSRAGGCLPRAHQRQPPEAPCKSPRATAWRFLLPSHRCQGGTNTVGPVRAYHRNRVGRARCLGTTRHMCGPQSRSPCPPVTQDSPGAFTHRGWRCTQRGGALAVIQAAGDPGGMGRCGRCSTSLGSASRP